jgi:hypothetical protein
MKKIGTLYLATCMLLSASLLTGCMTMIPYRAVAAVTYDNPQWAPPYYSGARYYYLPDLELYYDLSTREYIYLIDGRWHFSPYIPALYRNYDLDNCFSIVLNIDVYRPWLHHQYYLTHYPRYYYRDYYDHSGFCYVRAYNENLRRAVYWGVNERHRARPWDYEHARDNRRFKYSREDRREQQNQLRQEPTTFGGGSRGQSTGYGQNARPSERSQVRNERTEDRNVWTQDRNERAQQQNDRSQRSNERVQMQTERTSQNKEGEAVRNNRTNYYGKPIGNSVRVTRQMRDNENVPATRSAQKAPVEKSTPTVRNSRSTSTERQVPATRTPKRTESNRGM